MNELKVEMKSHHFYHWEGPGSNKVHETLQAQKDGHLTPGI